MKIGILKETQKSEKRVSVSPNIAKLLIAKGFEILVEKEAGSASSFKDSDYSEIGALVQNKATIFKNSIIIFSGRFCNLFVSRMSLSSFFG